MLKENVVMTFISSNIEREFANPALMNVHNLESVLKNEFNMPIVSNIPPKEEQSIYLGQIFSGSYRRIKILPISKTPLITTTFYLDNDLMSENYRHLIFLSSYESNQFAALLKDIKNFGEMQITLDKLIKKYESFKSIKEKTDKEEQQMKLLKIKLDAHKALMNDNKITVSEMGVKLSFSWGLNKIVAKAKILYFNQEDGILVVDYVNKNQFITKEVLDNMKNHPEEYEFERLTLKSLIDKFLKPYFVNKIEFKYNHAPEYMNEMALMEYEQVMPISKFKTINIQAPEVLSPIKDSLISSMIATASNGTEGILSEREGFKFLYKAAMIPISETGKLKVNGEDIVYKEKYWKPFLGFFAMDFKKFNVLASE